MSIQTASQAETQLSMPLEELVESHLRWISELGEGVVRARIEDQRVTLTGDVEWTYQREAAEQAVRQLPGVGSVANQIVVAARTPLRNAEARLRNAMFRDPQIDADLVHVTITGPTAVLTGEVKSLAEKRQAGLAAWISPGVIEVDNRLVIRPPASSRRSRP